MCGGYWSSSRWLCLSVCWLVHPRVQPSVGRFVGPFIHPTIILLWIGWYVDVIRTHLFVFLWFLFWCGFLCYSHHFLCHIHIESNSIRFGTIHIRIQFSSSFILPWRSSRERESLEKQYKKSYKKNIKNRIRKIFKNILSFFIFFKILSLCFSSVLNNIWCFTTKVVSLHSAKISEFCSSISCLRHMCDSNFWKKKQI